MKLLKRKELTSKEIYTEKRLRLYTDKSGTAVQNLETVFIESRNADIIYLDADLRPHWAAYKWSLGDRALCPSLLCANLPHKYYTTAWETNCLGQAEACSDGERHLTSKEKHGS